MFILLKDQRPNSFKIKKNFGPITFKPNYVYIVESSTKYENSYSETRLQCKGNQWSSFQGINKHFKNVHINTQVNNNTKGAYCCFSIATMLKRKCSNIKLHVHSLSCATTIPSFEVSYFSEKKPQKSSSKFALFFTVNYVLQPMLYSFFT